MKMGVYVELETPEGEMLKDLIKKDPVLSGFLKTIDLNIQMKEMLKAFEDWEREIKLRGYKAPQEIHEEIKVISNKCK